MKRILFICIFICINLYGLVPLPYSSEREDGINLAFQEFDKFVRKENNKLVKRWQKLKDKQITDILNNGKRKKRLLNDIKIIKIEDEVNKKEYLFELNKYKNLKNNHTQKDIK